jgi:hypothetical protein
MTAWKLLGYPRLWQAFDACIVLFPPEEQRGIAKTLLNTLLYDIRHPDESGPQ